MATRALVLLVSAVAAQLCLQQAQIHATLALTAAVALFDDEDFDWKQAVRS